ncbi:unnamed protein product [Paramecium octaurelia]|uniref:Uncharacterized protein n=1 Tax=Paramecium octaurelia TaxID=43137 RepID=A0A8S1T9T6_PAROT|nr:unnamed protein product [Paramecium octaurelia]
MQNRHQRTTIFQHQELKGLRLFNFKQQTFTSCLIKQRFLGNLSNLQNWLDYLLRSF